MARVKQKTTKKQRSSSTRSADSAAATADLPQEAISYDQLEEYVREHVRGFIQRVLEDEVTQFVGRERYARREAEEEEQQQRKVYRNIMASLAR